LLPVFDGLGSQLLTTMCLLTRSEFDGHRAPLSIRDCDGRDIELTVRDDGIGCDGTERSGRGLASMSRRASALGARLRVEAAQPGTRVWLTCPVAAPAD
jgi:nitrate/nitrite-specific signal transduction histidine kinase